MRHTSRPVEQLTELGQFPCHPAIAPLRESDQHLARRVRGTASVLRALTHCHSRTLDNPDCILESSSSALHRRPRSDFVGLELVR